jgi:hypothetical protein
MENIAEARFYRTVPKIMPAGKALGWRLGRNFVPGRHRD